MSVNVVIKVISSRLPNQITILEKDGHFNKQIVAVHTIPINTEIISTALKANDFETTLVLFSAMNLDA